MTLNMIEHNIEGTDAHALGNAVNETHIIQKLCAYY